MGVKGLMVWLKKTFPDSFTAPAREVDHLLVDANSLVHDSIRHCSNEQMAIRRLLSSLDKVVAAHQPSLSVIVALDGPAPFAKLATQRSRRLKKATGGKGLSPNAVTPGTSFMALVDEALLGWGTARASRARPQTIVIDPATSPGEGEVKIFRHRSSSGGETTAVVGGDSDLVLLSLAAPSCEGIQVVDSKTKSAFCCQSLRQLLSRDGGSPRERLDSFVVLCLFCGNDYSASVEGFDINTAYAAWDGSGRPTLVRRSPFELNLPELGKLCAAMGGRRRREADPTMYVYMSTSIPMPTFMPACPRLCVSTFMTACPRVCPFICPFPWLAGGGSSSRPCPFKLRSRQWHTRGRC